GFPHNPDIFINPLPQFTLLLASLFFTTSFTFSKIQVSHLYWGLSYLPASGVHWTSGQRDSVWQCSRYFCRLDKLARSELQWLTLTSCSTLRDLSYTSSPSRIAKRDLSPEGSKKSCAPMTAIHPPSEWSLVPSLAFPICLARDNLGNPPSSSFIDPIVEVKSKIKLYATEHPGDRTAVDMIYYSLADHTDGRALVANASHTHPGGEKLVCQTDASPYVSSTPGNLSCRSDQFPWGTKGHLSRRLD
ncbi:unnamed protein product, partial [Fusarium graminearum]